MQSKSCWENHDSSATKLGGLHGQGKWPVGRASQVRRPKKRSKSLSSLIKCKRHLAVREPRQRHGVAQEQCVGAVSAVGSERLRALCLWPRSGTILRGLSPSWAPRRRGSSFLVNLIQTDTAQHPVVAHQDRPGLGTLAQRPLAVHGPRPGMMGARHRSPPEQQRNRSVLFNGAVAGVRRREETPPRGRRW